MTDKKHDLVPADYVSNCVIASTWYYGVSRYDKYPKPISQCVYL